MSQCESTHNGNRCERKAGHGIGDAYPTREHVLSGYGNWSDEQADKPEFQPCNHCPSPLGCNQDKRCVLPDGNHFIELDPILEKTGYSREWWRYHFAGRNAAAIMGDRAAFKAAADEALHTGKLRQEIISATSVRVADALLEELEK